VGTLVVVDGTAPIDGIVTDRDLVLRGLAGDGDVTLKTVRDVMTRGPAAVQASLPVEHALGVMADQKVRRVVVLDEEGALLGLLALDDVVSFLVEEADAVARLIRRQVPV
jgi:CBS domain-containing protein